MAHDPSSSRAYSLVSAYGFSTEGAEASLRTTYTQTGGTLFGSTSELSFRDQEHVMGVSA